MYGRSLSLAKIGCVRLPPFRFSLEAVTDLLVRQLWWDAVSPRLPVGCQR